MKPIDEMTGTEKAAALLVAMGPEAAADILRYMDEKEVMAVSMEMAAIEKLSPEQKEDLMGDFFVTLKRQKGSTIAGEGTAKKILSDAFGKEKADEILEKVKKMNADTTFSFLKDASPEEIVDLVAHEHPQIIAVMLAKIESSKAGAVLRLLPVEMKKEIALRMAKTGSIAPEAVAQASIALSKKYENLASKGSTEGGKGLNAIADIMNFLSPDAEKRIMDRFDDEMPEFAGEVRKRISFFEFEAITQLTNREIRLVLSKISENRVIARALKGTEDDIRYRILRNMSANRAEDVISLIDLMGPIRLSEVNDARLQIVSVMKDLSSKGLILIRKSGDEIVE